MLKFWAIALALFLYLLLLVFPRPVWGSVAIQFYDSENLAIVEGGVKAKVHLACIKVPHLDQPLGKLAFQELKELIGDRFMGVKSFRRDRVGRVIGEVYADGNNVNLQMVELGLAEFDRQFPYVKECVGYSEAEVKAKQLGLGIWHEKGVTGKGKCGKLAIPPLESLAAGDSP